MIEDFKPLIKNTKFVHLWVSQVLSQLTINIMNFLLLIRIFEHTGSAIATSLLLVAYALPAAIIGPFAAASADLADRRKILMIANLAQSAAVFAYGIGFGTSFFLIYGIALTYSFLNQFYPISSNQFFPKEYAGNPTGKKMYQTLIDNDLHQMNKMSCPHQSGYPENKSGYR